MNRRKDKYYIVDLTNLLKPRLFLNEFSTRGFAATAIEKYLGADYTKYEVIKGSDARKYNILFKYQGTIKITKYDYPAHSVETDFRIRKSFRTQERRRKRRRLKKLEKNNTK